MASRYNWVARSDDCATGASKTVLSFLFSSPLFFYTEESKKHDHYTYFRCTLTTTIIFIKKAPFLCPAIATTPILGKQLQTTAMLSNLANLADRAHRTLVLAVVLGPVKGALLVRGATVNGSEAGRADLELGELVELNLHSVVRVALALRLGSLGLLFVKFVSVLIKIKNEGA